MRTTVRSLLAPTFAGLLLLTASPAVAADALGSDEPDLERPASACDPSHEAFDRQFDDVRAGATHAANIRCIAGWNITEGRTFTTFAPQDATTRDEMASFMLRLGDRVAGPEARDDALWLPFSDVDESNRHAHAIGILQEAGIVNGVTEDTYEPRRAVSRAQMAAFISRLHRSYFDGPLVQEIATFPDVPAGSTHADDIGRLAAAGIALGDGDGNYRPTAPVTREQMASFMARYLEMLHDQELIAPDRYPQHTDPALPVAG